MRFVAESFERVIVMRSGTVILDGPPAAVFAASNAEALASTFLEAPLAARLGERLGLGTTPTEAALIEALAGAAG
jgi:energy-coupling factor transporter ATP-binding protein EcfA2